jgi:hypothetical protein
MDVTELLHELVIVADVEIVIALLPEMQGRIFTHAKGPTQAKRRLEWGTVGGFVSDWEIENGLPSLMILRSTH